MQSEANYRAELCYRWAETLKGASIDTVKKPAHVKSILLLEGGNPQRSFGAIASGDLVFGGGR